MKPIRTWILIADGARARILFNEGPGLGLHPVDGALFETGHAPTGDINADRPGRAFDSDGEGRHSMESPTDPHRQAKKAFAGVVGDYVNRQVAAKEFDRLIIVAAPSTMGDLRDALSVPTKALVTGELDKDLTHVPNQDIGPYLDGLLIA